MIKSHKLAGDPCCPVCSKRLDGATGFGEKAPNPGDPCVCCYCGTLVIMGEDKRFRMPTRAEWTSFMDDERTRAVSKAVNLMILDKRRSERK